MEVTIAASAARSAADRLSHRHAQPPTRSATDRAAATRAAANRGVAIHTGTHPQTSAAFDKATTTNEAVSTDKAVAATLPPPTAVAATDKASATARIHPAGTLGAAFLTTGTVCQDRPVRFNRSNF